MKRVSLKVQKILVFIPIVNCAILFIFLFNFSRTYAPWSVYAKWGLCMMGLVLAFGGVGYLCSTLLPEAVYEWTFRIGGYVDPLLLGWFTILYQQKTGFKEETK